MSLIAQLSSLRAVGLSASPGGTASHSRLLLQRALDRLQGLGVATVLVDLAGLPADALLGRGSAPAFDRALAAVASANLLVVASPVYRASYSGLLKVFFDLLPEDALADKVAVPIASGGGPGHLLAIDHGLRPLLASLGATVVAAGIYVTPAAFEQGAPTIELLERLDRRLTEAVSLTAATAARLESLPAPRQRHAGVS